MINSLMFKLFNAILITIFQHVQLLTDQIEECIAPKYRLKYLATCQNTFDYVWRKMLRR